MLQHLQRPRDFLGVVRYAEHFEEGLGFFVVPPGLLVVPGHRLPEPPRADAWESPGSDQHRACYLPPNPKV